jgi:hypothetical protein
LILNSGFQDENPRLSTLLDFEAGVPVCIFWLVNSGFPVLNSKFSGLYSGLHILKTGLHLLDSRFWIRCSGFCCSGFKNIFSGF